MELVQQSRVASDPVNPTNIVFWTLALLGAALLASFSGEALPVVLPIFAIVGLLVAVVLHFYRIDGQLPVFDLGMLTILTTALYAIIPPLGFLLAGMQWTALTYFPLYRWNPGPTEVGAFTFRALVYLCSFTSAYLLFRGSVAVRSGRIRILAPTAIAAVVLCGLTLTGYFSLLQWLFDFSYQPSYRALTVESATAAAERVPYVVRQVSHNLFAILFLVKLCLIVWLMSHWDDWRWRTVLFVFLGAEGLTTIMRMGARTALVMLLMATGLLYHRLVKPLAFVRAVMLVAALLGGALVYGFARDLGAGVGINGLTRMANTTSSRWVTMNEFQALFGITYDLHARQAAGTLGPIPWQIYVSDLLQLVPSQVLPFSKADPCVGYPVVEGMGLGCVIGVMSQAVVGLDWIELVVRGLLLGVLFALIHRWYARRQNSYWATMFYLCLCLWCHYTFRNSTFFIAYYVFYWFVPFLIGVRMVQLLVRGAIRMVDSCAV